MRFGWVAYIVPFLFVYSPAILLKGSLADIVLVTLTSLAGIWLICAAMTGYGIRVISIPRRALFFAAGVLLMLPHQISATVLWLKFAGAAMGIALVVYEFAIARRLKIAQA
jgi:TRAP-type uncharacterized transport system fused permease subunit